MSDRTTTRRAFLGTASLGAATVAGGAFLAGPARAVAATVTDRPSNGDIALTHVTLIDPTDRRPRLDQTVILAGEQIVRTGRSAEVPIPHGARLIDLSGKYLIPGLCDMHVHSSADNIDVPLYIANGVTTVREMWGHPYLHEWRDRIEKGTLLGPQLHIASAIIDGSPTLWNDSGPRPSAPIVVTNEVEGRRAVQQSIKDGADFIKIYSRLSPQAFRGIADESHRRGIRFGGHLPDEVSAEDAVRAGMWSFEHLDGLWWSTSDREADIRRAIAAMKIDPKDAYGSWFQQIGPLEWEGATSYRGGKAAALFARLRRGNSWQVPTLTMQQRLDMPGDAGDPRLKYVPAGDAEFWQMWADARTKERTPQEIAEHRVLFRLRQRLVGALSEAEVPILAGTDTGTTYIFPGFSLHDELGLLVRAGMTPRQALAAATYEPAKALGLQGSQGTISRGKIADLVVLDANPLTDIRNTQRIHAVVVRGKVISTAQRQELLDGAARAANPPGAAPAARSMAGCGCHAHSV